MAKLIFPKGTVIEVIGNVASGKTTLARLLPSMTNLTYQDTDLFEQNPFMVASVEDPKRWVFTEELFFYFIRSKKIPEVKASLKKGPIVLDQGFFLPSFMYADNRLRSGHMSKEEWMFMRDIFGILTKDAPLPHIVIYLKAPIQTLMKRMRKRGRRDTRKHEKLYTSKYLKDLMVGLEEYIEKSKNSATTIVTYDFETDKFSTTGKRHKELERVIGTLVRSFEG